MSDRAEKSTSEEAADMALEKTFLPDQVGSDQDLNAAEPASRLQTIHELVRTGRYHVPAAIIADRMIAERRRRA